MWTLKLFRVRLQGFFRRAGVLYTVENLRYYLKRLKYRKSNRIFLKENPDFVLPPEHLAYDAYNAPKWNFYKYSGEGTAKFIREVADRYFVTTNSAISVYEWGCGPGRVIRHIPSAFGNAAKVYGTDYNRETVEWCKKNIQGVIFNLNELNPPLSFTDSSFEIIYCISVFTHLGEETGLKWANELHRVLKPGGILIMTTSGDNFYNTELLPKERKEYNSKGVVVRGQYTEGKKMFLTRHNPAYVRNVLLKQFEINEFLAAGFPYIEQDCWIARKSS